MSSIKQNIEQRMAEQQQRMAELEQSVAELRQSVAELKATPAPATAVKAKKPKKAPSAEGEAKPPKAPSDWNRLYLQTVADMKENGWESWTDLNGKLWPPSKAEKVTVKDKKTGAESESYVFDGGEEDGKPPSPSLGGMVRASYLRSLTDPKAKAKAEAYHAKLAEKRSNSSVGSAAPEEPEGEVKKGGRPKMTEEQKAAAKLKREAKKAAAAAAAAAPEPEAEESTTPTLVASPMVGGGGSAPPPKKAVKKAVKQAVVVDLNFRAWEHEGQSLFKNGRGDVISEEHEWLGRFDGSEIDESVPEPDDLGDVDILGEAETLG